MTAPMAAFSDPPNPAVATPLVAATTTAAGARSAAGPAPRPAPLVEPRRQTPHRRFLLEEEEAPTPSRALVSPEGGIPRSLPAPATEVAPAAALEDVPLSPPR